ncbi:MAG TPA: CvpA family protein [Candidatus Binataceae bacterium]|nr:CvpA family protein [Candidatus Binataceae bacterium]
MNAFDFLVIGIAAAGAIYGLRQGLLRMITSAIALLAAIYVASVYYTRAGEIAERQFGAGSTAGSVIGYLVVFILIFSAIEVIGTTAIRLTQFVHLSWADRLVGSLLGAGLTSVMMGIAVILLAAILPPDAAFLRQSRLAPMLIEYNETLVRYIPQQATDAYESNRENLMRYWIAEAETAVTHAHASPAASPSASK